MQFNTMQCNTLQSTQCNTMQFNSTQCNTIQCNSTQCNTMQFNSTQCNTMQVIVTDRIIILIHRLLASQIVEEYRISLPSDDTIAQRTVGSYAVTNNISDIHLYPTIE